MKFYYDTEFLEGTQTKRFIGIPFGETKPTIDLISIGIVDDGWEMTPLNIDASGQMEIRFERSYYAISKDFNLKEAWNRYQIEQCSGDMRNQFPEGKKVYWIRENVLKPIFEELSKKSIYDEKFIKNHLYTLGTGFTFHHLETLINFYGKSNKQIAQEVTEFIYGFAVTGYPKDNTEKIAPTDIQLYSYYGAYDHVVLCWLFGKMIDLPKGFPMYTTDLKQMLDEKSMNTIPDEVGHIELSDLDHHLMCLKNRNDYPKQENEHSAIYDARWNKKLHQFIQTL